MSPESAEQRALELVRQLAHAKHKVRALVQELRLNQRTVGKLSAEELGQWTAANLAVLIASDGVDEMGRWMIADQTKETDHV